MLSSKTSLEGYDVIFEIDKPENSTLGSIRIKSNTNSDLNHVFMCLTASEASRAQWFFRQLADDIGSVFDCAKIEHEGAESCSNAKTVQLSGNIFPKDVSNQEMASLGYLKSVPFADHKNLPNLMPWEIYQRNMFLMTQSKNETTQKVLHELRYLNRYTLQQLADLTYTSISWISRITKRKHAAMIRESNQDERS